MMQKWFSLEMNLKNLTDLPLIFFTLTRTTRDKLKKGEQKRCGVYKSPLNLFEHGRLLSIKYKNGSRAQHVLFLLSVIFGV